MKCTAEITLSTQEKLVERVEMKFRLNTPSPGFLHSYTSSSFMKSDEVKYTFYSQVKMLTANIQNTNSAFVILASCCVYGP